jgi:hypothetical protein
VTQTCELTPPPHYIQTLARTLKLTYISHRYVYPPGNDKTLYFDAALPTAANQYGTLDFFDNPSVTMENGFWNKNVTGITGVQGTYIVVRFKSLKESPTQTNDVEQCLDPLTFNPTPSPTRPLGYNVRVFFENRVITFAGAITYDAATFPSPACRPNGNANPNANIGFYIGSFSCTCCGADYSSDGNNCGGCGNTCGVTQTCTNGRCLGAGQIGVTSSWQRFGDLNLLVFSYENCLRWN